MPPRGANEGDAIDASEGEDSAWRRDGVGGTTSVEIPDNDLLNVGVWMVRLATRRLVLLLLAGIAIGDGGVSKWCCDVSTADAVAIGGRD